MVIKVNTGKEQLAISTGIEVN